MSQTTIFAPLFAMVLLTFGIGMLMLRARIRAVRDGLNPGYFHFNRGARLPDELVKVSQHYENLFELPVLFYAACLALYVTDSVDMTGLVLAWVYVASRLVHAYVHLGHNRLRSRRRVFLLGMAVLFSLWIKLMLAIY